jgi:hypothetical protein
MWFISYEIINIIQSKFNFIVIYII